MFKKKPPQPKTPRKKVQIQLKTIQSSFNEALAQLDNTLERSDLLSHTRSVGRQIRQYAFRFQELQFIRLNQARLNSISSPLIDPDDFSLWVNWEMKNLTEKMQEFNLTV